MKKELFKKLPKVDEVIKLPEMKELAKNIDYFSFTEGIREGIDRYRRGILEGNITTFEKEDILEEIRGIVTKRSQFNLKNVINATGTVVHTNLGRSLISEKAAKNVVDVITSYNNLEYNLEKGGRGSRYDHVEELICQVTGAEAAVLTNNNAAAVMLALNEFANNGEAVVSRGELVEIGGSFRVPDIMELSGTKLVEVGTTNRTHARDYRKAITEDTSMLLKIHTSNYKIIGFTKTVTNEELVEIGRENNVLTMEDLGSGVLVDFSKYGVKKEPTVQESIASGIDLVTFSGDKLLGGPQLGVIVGKKKYIDRLKKNQLLRALRVSKMTIAALEPTLRYYLDEREAVAEIPTLRMILEAPEKVEARAERLHKLLTDRGVACEAMETEATIGGGSMPGETVESYGVAIEGNSVELEKAFRLGTPNIVGMIRNDRFILDVKAIQENEMEVVAERAAEITGKMK
ncbi:L-seryl-tRNA(Sec) selenium transferase [Propionigenium maris DSM 9537]|uniref:L-seryl-tRNA(Sec) selenium transferase n=1 Tax=Propionigenium maris DSM 9537 TaxID=1123000 RepID=A0A9W6LNR2_9FUSO|nr:L-seryl-tRNA(Sec) selenium transferase [Propionigenium maris]GLI56195.1 L-seryl-tRNA(Sec) selenium transferase [Propionigenium maris DSM 9537]